MSSTAQAPDPQPAVAAARLGRSSDNVDSRPPPRDFGHYYSETTKNREMGVMKRYYKFFQIPGVGNFAGGLPNVSYFPFDTLEAQTAKPDRWTPTPNHPNAAGCQDNDDDDDDDKPASFSSSDPMATAHITVPKEAAPSDDPSYPLKKIDLATALQYGMGEGYPPLLSWIRQFTRENLHPAVPYHGGPGVVMTVGSTDGFAKTLELFVDPWSEKAGDDVRNRPGLLCERFVYGNILSQSEPKGIQIVSVEADGDGMRAYGPGGLDDVLANWDESKGRRPHLMYTVTMGHNPTGILLGVERRREIYAVCSKYDVIIIEDDPYWYMQFPSAAVEQAKSRNHPLIEAPSPSIGRNARNSTPSGNTGYPFLDSLVPSFLSLDTDGRVVRLDTFSKTVAPGCRLGWITAQPALIERFVRITEATTQQPSGFVQSLIGELVMGPQPPAAVTAFRALRSQHERSSFTGWSTAGWVRWLEGLRGAYERRMNRVCRILDEGAVQLKQGTPLRSSDADWGVITKTTLYEFLWPRGGMFIWIRMRFESHPMWGKPRERRGPSDGGNGVIDGPVLSTALMVLLTKKPYLVVTAPGTMFAADEQVRNADAWAYLRLCFAAEAEEKVDPCARRFVDGIHRFWRIKKASEIEDLLAEFPGAAAAGVAPPDEDEGTLGNLGVYLGC